MIKTLYFFLFPLFMLDAITIQTFQGKELAPHLDSMIALCNTVYREYPYLYDGTSEEYTDYLTSYTSCNQRFVVLAFDGDKLTGALLSQPMITTWDKYHEPLVNADYNLNSLFFIGELVILPAYRKQGIARKLLERVETYAKDAHFSTLALYSQIEDPTHPLRPKNYTPIDPFWIRQGFTKHPELNLSLQWIDVQGNLSNFQMIYWLKAL